VDAAWLGLVRDLDARPEAVAGAQAGRVAATFLTHRLHVTSGQAHTDVAAAQAITPEGGLLAGLGAALAAGQVSRAHLDVAVRAVRRIPKRLLAGVDPDGRSGAARVDAYLTEQAQAFCPRTVEQLAARLLAVLDPARADRYDPDAYTRRRLSCGTDSTGMTIGQYQLHPAGGAVFKAALDHYSRPAPGVSATTPDGQEILLADDRTPEQRRADALVTIARIALHATNNGTTPANPLTHVTVIATAEQLAAAHHAHPQPTPAPVPEADGPEADGPDADCGPDAQGGPDEDDRSDAPGESDEDDRPDPAGEPDADDRPDADGEPDAEVGSATQPLPDWATGTTATRTTAAGMTATGTTAAGMADCVQTGPLTPGTLGLLGCDALLQAVFLTPSGAVLNLGRTVRTASTAQRRALLARDRGCVVPGCTAPLAAVDVHHITYWRHGGGTDLDNVGSR
jgi:hypothetical protein